MELRDYDERLARDIDQRATLAHTNQQARDARRADYDNALASMPITLALRTLRVPTSRNSGSGWAPKAPVPHKDTRMATGKNDWESNAPHARTHLSPDKGCHHPLVRCSHKW